MARLVLAREEDRVVGEAKRLDPAVGTRWKGGGGILADSYDGSSFLSTSSSSRGKHRDPTQNATAQEHIAPTIGTHMCALGVGSGANVTHT